jgi:hypothetical protein
MHAGFFTKGPFHPFVDLVISPTSGHLQSREPLAQIEQFFMPLAQETQVFVDHISRLISDNQNARFPTIKTPVL